jgi:hypothetical protein
MRHINKMKEEKEEEFKEGDVVYLTPAAQDFLSRNRGDKFNINVVGRLSYIWEIYDWNTNKGKKILKDRIKSDKEKGTNTWDKLGSEKFKYVIITEYPELKKEGDPQGLSMAEIFSLYHPMSEDKKIPLFRKYPKDMLKGAFFLNKDFELKENNIREKEDVSRPTDKQRTPKSKKLPRSNGLSDKPKKVRRK